MTAKEQKAAKKERRLEFLRQQIRTAREGRRSEPVDVFFWGEGGRTKLKELNEEQLWEELARARQGRAPFGLNEVQMVKRVEPPQEAQALDEIPQLIECEMTVKQPVVSPQEAQVQETVQKVARETERSAPDESGELGGARAVKLGGSGTGTEGLKAELSRLRTVVDGLPEGAPQKGLYGRVLRMFEAYDLDELAANGEMGDLLKGVTELAEMLSEIVGDKKEKESERKGTAVTAVGPQGERRVPTAWGVRREYGCYYCWRPGHWKRGCPDLRADMASGRCRMGAWNRVLYADGTEVPFERGRSLCERVRGRQAARTIGMKAGVVQRGGLRMAADGRERSAPQEVESRGVGDKEGELWRTWGELEKAVGTLACKAGERGEGSEREDGLKWWFGKVERLVREMEKLLRNREGNGYQEVRARIEGLRLFVNSVRQREGSETGKSEREEPVSRDGRENGTLGIWQRGDAREKGDEWDEWKAGKEMFAYKAVAKKVRPVPTTMPEEMRVERVRHPDPLEGMPELPVRPPEFTPGERLTQERHDAMDWNPDGFLTSEEVKLVKYVAKAHEKAMAWDKSEKGTFDEEYFPPVRIPTIEHVPWVLKNIPIPNGIRERVIEIIKDKIASGVYEPSNASYRSRWFCVVKKDGKSLRLVHDLQPLNGVSIKDAAVPPFVDQLGESYAGRACYSSYDLFVAFDQRKLDVRSRDMTTFQTPMGTFRLTSIPMGYTNSMQILHNDVCFMLRDYIPEVTEPFVDDIVTKGPKTRYERPDGSYETIPGNPGIRRFIWEHLLRDNEVLQVLKSYGVTVSGPKMTIARAAGLIVGNKCTYEGRVPDESKVKKIVDWPTPKNATEVRGFLGTASVLRIFIQDFGRIARPLTDLIKKNVEFVWDQACAEAMAMLKQRIEDSPALRPIDYKSERAVILAVDSSIIGYGYILYQEGEDGRRYPNRFGSGTWNTRESNYSQAKIELYGLFRALRAVRGFIVGIINLIVEVDAKYIKGMINNPDIQPNATINRWIAGILLFHFKLVHVPAARHHGADGMSRRRRADGEADGDDEAEDWIDEMYGFMFEAWARWGSSSEVQEILAMEGQADETKADEPRPPTTERRERQEKRLEQVRAFLVRPERPEGMSDGEYKQFIRQVLEYFEWDSKLWKKSSDGKHRIVPVPEKRTGLMAMAHDQLGHKGVFAVKENLRKRFWWPGMEQDVKWFVRTCHDCQTRQYRLQHIPPVVATPAPLFHKVFIDTMLMPAAGGFKYIIQARDSLTLWVEWRALRTETARTVQSFIFEEIFCRWGPVYEVVMDNGKPFVAEAVNELYKKYKVSPVRISAYNSQANGAVERRHRDVREAIMKMVKGDETKWPSVVHAVFWAERITVQKATGMSPYEMAHGVEPILPFDLAEATFMVRPLSSKLSSAELLAIRARQLLKRPGDLRKAHARILKSRNAAARQFEKRFQHTISTREFKPGELVLVRNTRVEKELNKKTKPRYLGPYVVLRRTAGGSYILSELDGAVARARFGAFRVIPYFARESIDITPEDLAQMSKGELDELAAERESHLEDEEEEDDTVEGQGAADWDGSGSVLRPRAVLLLSRPLIGVGRLIGLL